MAFTPKDWRNDPDHSTPLSAEALEDLEVRVTDYTDDERADLEGDIVTALAAKADLASPALTGNPTAPTQSQGNNTTRLATTAYVQTEAGLLVPKSLIDAKGDLIVGTAADTPGKLTVGTDGYVLTARSGQAAGMAWEAAGGVEYPWTVDIDPFPTPATQTNWSELAVQTAAMNNGWLRSTGAQNAEVGWDIVLGAGTWTIAAVTTTSTDSGIVTAYLDGVSVGTMDQYSASTVQNARQTITGIAVATSGKKRLLLKMATKNGSSSSYYGRILALGLRRTA